MLACFIITKIGGCHNWWAVGFVWHRCRQLDIKGTGEVHTGLWWVKLKERVHLEDLDVGGRIILTHCGRVTQICVFNTVKLGTSASSP